MHRADLSPVHPGHGQNAENPLTAQVGAHFTPKAHIRPNARSAPPFPRAITTAAKPPPRRTSPQKSTKTQPQRGFAPIRKAPRRFKNYLQI